MLPHTISKEKGSYGKRVIDISQLVDVFEAQEGLIFQIIGKTGNGKTYYATFLAYYYLLQGYTVYTTWKLNLPKKYDERNVLGKLIWRTLFFWNKRFYVFDLEKNWHYVDIDRPDLINFVATRTDCIFMMDEGQDIFDSRERADKTTRKSLTRTRHLRKTLYIISQRAQAVDVTARANVTFFYKCVKTWRIYWPFRSFFKVYRTEEMDNQNYPIWEDVQADWQAELFWKGFARDSIYNMYNSWYLRAGIEKSQEVNFEAYDLTLWERIKAIALYNVFDFKRLTKTEGYAEKVKKLNIEAIKQDIKLSPQLSPDVGKKPLKEVLLKHDLADKKNVKLLVHSSPNDGGQKSIPERATKKINVNDETPINRKGSSKSNKKLLKK